MSQLAEDAQRPVGLVTLEEHHVGPPRRRGLLDGGVGVPCDPAGRDETLGEPVVGPVDEVRRLAQLLRSSQRIPHPGLVAPVVVERVRGLALVNIGDLIEHLPQRPHPRREVADHPVHLCGLIERTARVSQPPQSLGRLGGVGSGIEERGHHEPPDTSCVMEVRRTLAKLSWIRLLAPVLQSPAASMRLRHPPCGRRSQEVRRASSGAPM